MVVQNISDVNQAIRRNVDRVKWSSIFSVSNLSNVIGRIILGILLLLFLNFLYAFIAHQFLSKEIITKKHFNTEKEHEIVKVPTIYAIMFRFTMFLITLSLLAHFLGIEIASIIVFFIFFAIVVGALIQRTIGNIIASLLISYFHTFEVGDVVKVNDIEGQIVDFNSLNTTIDDIVTLHRITVPNKVMYDSLVTNYSKSRAFVYSFTINVSNYMKDFSSIINLIFDDLKDKNKYPFVEFPENTDVSNIIHVDSFDHMGTKLTVHVHFKSIIDLINFKADVKTKIRLLLSSHNIQLFDNYSYRLDEEK